MVWENCGIFFALTRIEKRARLPGGTMNEKTKSKANKEEGRWTDTRENAERKENDDNTGNMGHLAEHRQALDRRNEKGRKGKE